MWYYDKQMAGSMRARQSKQHIRRSLFLPEKQNLSKHYSHETQTRDPEIVNTNIYNYSLEKKSYTYYMCFSIFLSVHILLNDCLYGQGDKYPGSGVVLNCIDS